MKTEGSLPHSQEPVTCPYPEPDQSCPCLPSHFFSNRFNITSHLRLCLPSSLFPSGFPTKTRCKPLLSLIPAACPVHLILLDLITRVIFSKFIVRCSSPLPCYLVPPTSKYPPQHPQPTFLPQCERPSLTPIPNSRQYYSSVYLSLIFRISNWKTKYSASNDSNYSFK
jgi:hypothetical protein